MPKLVLKHIGNGMDTVYEVHDDVATKMVEDGTAIRLPDGILREVEKPKAKKVEADYTTKEMKPVKKATKKG
jgi:hypothetical protein